MSTDNFTKVADENELKPGEGKGIEINGIEIALFNVDSDYYAVSNRCSHQQAPLCKVGEKKINGEKCWTEQRGSVDDENIAITCPWHLWEWGLQSGEHEVTGQRIGSFDVKVEDGDILVNL